MVTDNSKFKDIVALRGPDAQSVLNLLQAVCLLTIHTPLTLIELPNQRLDYSMDPAYRPRHVKALLKLSEASGLYPECLVLKGIEVGQQSVAVGGFGDVFKGRLYDRVVAVKALRICPSDLIKRL